MSFFWFSLTHSHQFIHGHSWTSATWWKTVFAKDRFSADDIPDLKGKVAIVTGANKGLGYHTTLELAAHGCKVIMACRSKERAMAAMEQIKQELRKRRQQKREQQQKQQQQEQEQKKKQQEGASSSASSLSSSSTDDANNNVNGSGNNNNSQEEGDEEWEDQLEFLQLDLTDMRQSHQAAHEFLAKGLPLHLLINNAGIGSAQMDPIDGIDCHMAVNHFGPFAFTLPLIDRLIESQPSRVVVLSSIAHECSVKGGINFERMHDPKLTDNYYRRYAQSKTANILFAKALARRVAAHKVNVNIVHPGVVDTAIFENIGSLTSEFFGKWFLRFNHRFGMRPARGALTPLYAATSPEIEEKDYRGEYFIPVGYRFWPKKNLESEELQERLWEYSEKLLAERLAKAPSRSSDADGVASSAADGGVKGDEGKDKAPESDPVAI
ncbi:hypothetical protein BGW42_003368 [Actinomortierella wolfii]|nr:hypothetical protein BGW42_003368 [Actinomortierella wolfii]